MADFGANGSSFFFELNTGTNAAPVYTNVLATGAELRWADVATAGGSTASASWPFSTRPAAGTAAVPYAYAYTADATGLGVLGTSTATPTAFTNANYLWGRWRWDTTGTYASAPIFTAYLTTAHAAITRGDNSVLGGNTTDTGATARSYLKGNAFGANTAALPAAPAVAPTNAPVVTDGTTGALTYAGAATWLTNYQGLQGDNDYIQYGATPSAVTAQSWNVICALFYGVNMATGTYLNTLSIRYTFT